MLLACAILAACRSESTQPVGAAANISAASPTTLSGVVGDVIPQPVVVTVTSATGKGVGGVTVTFAITRGFGTVEPRVATTDSKGEARATWTLGTEAGLNELTASVEHLGKSAVFTAVAAPGPTVGLSVSPGTLRIDPSENSGKIFARTVDRFGNNTGVVVTLVTRDPGLVGVDPSGTVTVVSRGGQTYVVGTAGALRDSARVVVLAPGDPACTGLDTVGPIAVGQVLTAEFVDGTICVLGGGEYVVSPFFDSPAPAAMLALDAVAYGITVPGPLSAATLAGISGASSDLTPARSDDVHDRIREQEHRLMPEYETYARAWYAGQRNRSGGGAVAAAIPAEVNIGDILPLNVNAHDFCSNPTMRDGRVVAITPGAVVVADVSNPAGGFTDGEYLGFAQTFDAVIRPLSVQNFGEPSDIDGNGRVVLFFTSAVNALSSGSSLTLGFYYSRDLLPKLGPLGSCPGSNVGEILYLLVPDPNGQVSTARSKADVMKRTNGTVAHELQHLINASRRLMSGAPAMTEERWLNEGLSHIAEELAFYAVTGLGPRQNLGDQMTHEFPLHPLNPAYQTYMRENISRLGSYLQQNETRGPIGMDDSDDALSTRGAIWSFLRYAADQRAAANEKDFWFRLVNSHTTGVANLMNVVGSDVKAVMRNWTIATFMDDRIGATSVYSHLSWNYRQFFSLPNRPVTRTLGNASTTNVTLRANGVGYLRFAIPQGGQAFAAVTTEGVPPPPTIKLSLIRTK